MGNVMGKRVGSLVLLLVFALGSGTVAQSPSPGAPPRFAPDDVGILLPSELGGVALTVTDWAGPDALAVSAETAVGKTEDLLIPMGKEPTDRSLAQAVTTDASAAAQYDIIAMRIAGVAADLVLDRMMTSRGSSGGSASCGGLRRADADHQRPERGDSRRRRRHDMVGGLPPR